MGPDTSAHSGEVEETGRALMKIDLTGSELSLIPETDEDHRVIKSFMASVEANDNDFVHGDLDGVNLDELVFQPLCANTGSHCDLCKQRLT